MLQHDPNQTIITDYFDVVNKIDLVIKENDTLHSMLRDKHINDDIQSDFATPFLNTLMQNAKKKIKTNCTTLPT